MNSNKLTRLYWALDFAGYRKAVKAREAVLATPTGKRRKPKEIPPMRRLMGPREYLVERHPSKFGVKMARIHMSPSWVRAENYEKFGRTKLANKLDISDKFLAEHDGEYLDTLPADDEDEDADDEDEDGVEEGEMPL